MVLSTLAGANIIYGAVKYALGEEVPRFRIRWGTRLLRYWGGIGVYKERIVGEII
jgi:carbamoyl-phosphate synthase large subunit